MRGGQKTHRFVGWEQFAPEQLLSTLLGSKCNRIIVVVTVVTTTEMAANPADNAPRKIHLTR
jgi:RPA family protein